MKFNLNPYTGCSHGCIYCYARTYIKDFNKPRVKLRLLQNIDSDLSKIPKGSLISMSNSSDPYTPPEDKLGLTREALRRVLEGGYRVLIITKSDLVVRDSDLLKRGNSVVSITVTTLDDEVSKKLEPNAPTPTKRLKALENLRREGIAATARIDPIIPYVNDDAEMLKELINKLADAGVMQVTASTLKVKADILRRVCNAFPEAAGKLRALYADGEELGNYIYLPRNYRLKYLTTVMNLCYVRGLPFTTCREALRIATPGIGCDGSTFINMPNNI